MTITDRLNEIEARANAATKGPWSTFGRGTVVGTADKDGWRNYVVCSCSLSPGIANANFVAAARTDVPALCAAVRRAVEELELSGTFGAREALADIEEILK